MTSDQSEKNLAFLTRRVKALENRLAQSIELAEHQADIIDRCVENQERWAPWFEQRHIENKADHHQLTQMVKRLIDNLL